MEGLLDFFTRDAGQRRTRSLLDFINTDVAHYVPPNLRKPLGLLAEMNPVQDIYRAGGNIRGGNYVDAGIDTAIAAAPVVGGVLGRVGANQLADTGGDAARAAMDTLLGGAPGRSASAVDAFAERANQRGPVPDMHMFAGPKAKTADMAALSRAQEMAETGVNRDDIWRETGWFTGVDGKWRFEIDDRNINLRSAEETAAMAGDMRGEAKGLLDSIKQRNADLKTQPDLFPGDLRRAHGDMRRQANSLKREAGSNYGPEWNHATNGQRANYAVSGPLSDAYPDAMRETIVRTGSPSQSFQGSYNNQASKLDVSSNADDQRSTLLHELQHMVQSDEGFALGSNPQIGARTASGKIHSKAMRLDDDMKKKAANLSADDAEAWKEFELDPDAPFAREAFAQRGREAKEILRLWDASRNLVRKAADVPDRTAMQFYRRAAGEVEARNTQARRDFTPDQRRATPPWETQDVPDGGQIVRSGGGVQASTNITPAQQQAQEVLDLIGQGRASEVTDDMMAAADDMYLAQNYDLPLDEASRMQRAREMGFNEDALHGTLTGVDFQGFRGPRQSGRWKESYFAPNTKDGAKLTQQFSSGDQGRVFPVMIKGDDVLDTGRSLPERERFLDILDDNNLRADWEMGHNGGGFRPSGRPGWGNSSAIEAVGRESPAGMRLHERDWVESTAVFDPTQVRSRFARFDPRLSHLRNLSAGVGGVGLLSALTPQEEEEMRRYLEQQQ